MKVLFLSNGHGEDLNASLIVGALRSLEPSLQIKAMPLVGMGNAYRRLQVDIIGPTQNLPSGGIIYLNPWNWVKDITSGLIGLTLQQIRAVLQEKTSCDLLIAVGDIVPIAIAYLTGRPFVAFIVSTSSYYEGKLRLPWITEFCLRSPRCQRVFTRDEFTAEDLQQRGLKKAIFAGYPIMDVLQSGNNHLGLEPNLPMIALLPGSRLPEAIDNLQLQLNACEAIALKRPMQFRAALVPSITEKDLQALAQKMGWHYHGSGKLVNPAENFRVICYWDAFADILQQCDLVIGMAGTAVEQAVGLGKPVVQIPGAGPQFTYAFAEAQMRLLGSSVKTIGKSPKDLNLFPDIAQTVGEILDNPDYLETCLHNGIERVGQAGGSVGIAQGILEIISKFGDRDRNQL
ncbi:MAG: lipid-A-disaccharide synthase-related protein [Snowella sp.]|nr:lipid-A-disaccharide synthase-related protein [Snowella sp.]